MVPGVGKHDLGEDAGPDVPPDPAVPSQNDPDELLAAVTGQLRALAGEASLLAAEVIREYFDHGWKRLWYHPDSPVHAPLSQVVTTLTSVVNHRTQAGFWLDDLHRRSAEDWPAHDFMVLTSFMENWADSFAKLGFALSRLAAAVPSPAVPEWTRAVARVPALAGHAERCGEHARRLHGLCAEELIQA
jgi:hypothetical protein